MTVNTPLSGVVYNASVLLCIYQYTKFEVLSFTDCKHMIGAKL